MKYILGTAALGSHYGIANKGSEYSEKNSIAILKKASELGIKALDTAPAYGSAERIIGNYHRNHDPFEIHTKLSGKCVSTPVETLASIDNSLEKLAISRVDLLYFHDALSLISAPRINVKSILKAIEDCGKVKKIGVSVYTELEIERIANEWPQISTFQVPESILDRRLIKSKIVHQLQKVGKIFYVRSIFLQGLILMNPNEIPSRLESVQSYIQAFENYQNISGQTKIEVALSYLNSIDWAEGFLIGVNNPEQLDLIVNSSVGKLTNLKLPPAIPYPMIDPRTWGQE